MTDIGYRCAFSPPNVDAWRIYTIYTTQDTNYTTASYVLRRIIIITSKYTECELRVSPDIEPAEAMADERYVLCRRDAVDCLTNRRQSRPNRAGKFYNSMPTEPASEGVKGGGNARAPCIPRVPVRLLTKPSHQGVTGQHCSTAKDGDSPRSQVPGTQEAKSYKGVQCACLGSVYTSDSEPIGAHNYFSLPTHQRAYLPPSRRQILA